MLHSLSLQLYQSPKHKQCQLDRFDNRGILSQKHDQKPGHDREPHEEGNTIARLLHVACLVHSCQADCHSVGQCLEDGDRDLLTKHRGRRARLSHGQSDQSAHDPVGVTL